MFDIDRTDILAMVARSLSIEEIVEEIVSHSDLFNEVKEEISGAYDDMKSDIDDAVHREDWGSVREFAEKLDNLKMYLD